MGRVVVTVETIDHLIAQGVREHALGASDIVTALAEEYAQDKGVRLYRPGDEVSGSGCDGPTPGASCANFGADRQSEKTPDHAAVRTAVIAAVGYEPHGLDALISKVMN